MEDTFEVEVEETHSESSQGGGTLTILLMIALALLGGSIPLLGGGKGGGLEGAPCPLPHLSGYRQMACIAAVSARIPPDLFIRQINEESGFQNVTSPAGAVGMCQFLPGTAKGLGIDPYNPASCLKGAALMMARYMQEFGSYDKALAAYHCGGGCTRVAIARCGVAWEQCVPAETQRYIAVVMNE